MKTVIYTEAAARQLDALPEDAQYRVTEAIERYAVTGHGDVKRLTGRPALRMRVGTYRVLFGEDETTILGIYVGKRETTTYRRN